MSIHFQNQKKADLKRLTDSVHDLSLYASLFSSFECKML